MNKFLLILVLLVFNSCNLFESKEEKTQKLVAEKLLQIDWTDVDDYPFFDDCDETVSKALQKNCFEQKLLAHLSKGLKEFHLTSETEIKDIVFLDIRVEKDGNVTIDTIVNKEIFGVQMEKFQRNISKSIETLPHIEPALKEGIPVNAKFRIPILLNSK